MVDKLTTLMKFQEIFEQKKWIEMEGCDDKLDRFGSLIDTLSQDEITLLLELTKMYEWMSYNDYHNRLRTLLKLILTNHLKDKKRLLIFPIIKTKEEEEFKSGHVVMKMIESIKPSINGFKNIKIKPLKEFQDLDSKKLKMDQTDFLILVDDYVGSGKTLNSTLKELFKNSSITKENFAILTMAIQEGSQNLLDDNKITNYYSLIVKKGISDNFTSPDLEVNINLMKKIESRIPNVSYYSMGYEKSEALITLMRTPNNTFPVFWKGVISKGVEIEAPFQRY